VTRGRQEIYGQFQKEAQRMKTATMTAPLASHRLTLTEAAAQLGVCSKTLHNWVKAGRVRVVRLTSRSMHIEQEEINRLLRGEMTTGK
jgi:excisionase family DNA binding protein